ncbi:activating signal cointegrator 1 complex subunit 1 [Battus philenor]|uniref:activating signal cointegrator 1 complex subunit 1 n=1 Tax=Battus philenor TaxID=42288 RepID=UPI0035CFF2A9
MSDILRPELLWIEGRCYRLNDSNTEVSALQEHDLYENETVFKDLGDDDSDDNFEVTEIASDRYCTSLHVSKHYIGSIIGKKGIMKSRIERDTRTNIKIPKQAESGDITILGPSITNIKAARRRINIIVMSLRMKQKSTHFISIPLNESVIMNNFECFKQKVLHQFSSKGVEESLFIRANKLHITIGVMCLMDNEERIQASKLLAEANEKILKPLFSNHFPLRVRVKGLSYMNDDPKNIDVLYGCVEDEDSSTGIIQKVADVLVDYFNKAGFMDNKEYYRDNVKLHVTLMNSKYRDKSYTDNEVASNKRNVRQTFDGTDILNQFAEYDFGVTEIKTIHLSQRKSTGADGYYQPTFVVPLKIN